MCSLDIKEVIACSENMRYKTEYLGCQNVFYRG